ncbi:MAG: bifunctional nuclease family protein [Myxococcota bacterium]
MHWWLAGLLVLSPSFAGKQKRRQKEAPPDGFQEMVVKGVFPLPNGAVVVLSDKAEAHVIHMMVGPSEGRTIFLRHERRDFERPLTHDLFDEIMGFAQAEVVEVRLDDVRSDIYVARVTVETKRRKQRTVDARASDSIAMALGRGLPIYVADHVIEQMAVEPGERPFHSEDDPDEVDTDDPHQAL